MILQTHTRNIRIFQKIFFSKKKKKNISKFDKILMGESKCSGEKVVDGSWAKFVDIKGKVKLEAFEKFLQELPRSRNRSLMVSLLVFYRKISLKILIF